MSIKQISVFLENKRGALHELTDKLAEVNINMRALTIAESNDFGIARLLVDDVIGAIDVLKNAGFIAKLTNVLAYAIPDEAGGLNKLMGIITDTGIDVKYLYSSVVGGNKAYIVIKPADVEKAEALLAARGLDSIDSDQF